MNARRLKKQASNVLVTVATTVFILTSLTMLPVLSMSIQAEKSNVGDIIKSLLTTPEAYAQTSEDNQKLTPTGYLNPLLPDDVVPDFSINFSCNQKEEGDSRSIELYYLNRTDYRINLDRSTIRVGNIDINPYSVRDSEHASYLSDNGIRIVHTHFNSDLMFNPTDKSYLSKQEVLALPEDQQAGWVTAGNNGPIDYFNPGRNVAMVIEVPKNATVVWTAGVELSEQQSAVSGGRKRIQKTTTASTSNLKDCPESEVTPETFIPEELSRLPKDIEVGRYNAREYQTRECKLGETIESFKYNNLFDFDPQSDVYYLNLGNQTLTTEQTGSAKKLNNIKNSEKDSIIPGKYVVVLQSDDDHANFNKDGTVQRIKKDTQENESYKMQLINKDKEVLLESNALWDLKDDQNSIIQIVNDNLEITPGLFESIDRVQAINIDTWEADELKPNGRPDNQFKTSIRTTCAAFINLDQDEEEIEEEPVVEEEENEIPQLQFIVTQDQVQCLSVQLNESFTAIQFDPSGAPQTEAYINYALNSCFDEATVQGFLPYLDSLDDSVITQYGLDYATDFDVTPEEVELVLNDIATRIGAELVIARSEVESGDVEEVQTETEESIEQTHSDTDNSGVISYLNSFLFGVEVQAQTEVGGLDLFTYCKDGYGSGSEARLTGSGANGWTCNGVGINYEDVCDKQWGFEYYADIYDSNDPYSIRCLREIPYAPQGLDLWTYCQNLFGVPAGLQGSTANDWVCEFNNISIDFNDVCISQYGAGAYASTPNPNDPYSWVCMSGGNGGGSTGPIDSDGDGISDAEEAEINALIAEYEASVVTDADIASTDFEAQFDVNDDSVWSALIQIPQNFVADLDGFVNGDFQLDCGSIGVLCRTLLDSRTANMIKMIVDFIWGMFKGIGTFFTDIVDLVKMIWNIRDTISGLWGMITSLLTDPSSILNMVMSYIQDFLAKPIGEKLEFLGFIIGEQLKDWLIGIFTGGAGLAAKIGSVLSDVAQQVKNVSKVATRGINALEGLVGQTIKVGASSILIRVGGKIYGGDVLDLMKKSDETFEYLLKKMPDGPDKTKLIRKRNLFKDCIVNGAVNTSGACKFKSLERHFNNHASNFGFDSLDAYLDSALTFLLEKPRAGIQIRYDTINKTYRKYDTTTNTLVSYQDGKILTYFKPDEGIDYWNDATKNGKLYKVY